MISSLPKILKAPLQKETNPTLELIVVATDNGLPARKSSARVKIVVSDKNDYAPKFPRSKYVFDTLENLPSGTKIGVVQAEDKDEGLNGEVEYRFRAPNSRFQIQADSGKSLCNNNAFGYDDLQCILLRQSIQFVGLQSKMQHFFSRRNTYQGNVGSRRH